MSMLTSWLFGKPEGSGEDESGVPEATHGQRQRNKHIQSLRKTLRGVEEVTRDERYRLTIVSADCNLTLDILLPPRFPLVGPVVVVSPPVTHPWINEQLVVDGAPLINNFTVHSDLGRAVQQVVKEFTDHPPLPMALPPSQHRGSFPSSPPSTYPGTYSYGSMPQPVLPQGEMVDSPESRPRRLAPPPPSAGHVSYNAPPVPDTFPDLSAMTEAELERYLEENEGPVLIEKFVSQLDVIRKVRLDCDQLFQENEDQAGINLSHEPELQDGWAQLQQKYLELQSLQETHEVMLRDQQRQISKYQLQTVTTQLKGLTQEAETEAEVLGEDFLDSKMPVAEFIQKHRDQRKLHHLRKAKYEKLTYSRQ